MKLKVLRYDEGQDYHECRDENGKTHKVDLNVDGGIGQERKGLVGKTVECDYLHPYIEIANHVRFGVDEKE